jgi:hypothetical protein
MNVKNANQAKSVRVRLSIALYVLKDSLSGQTMSSRVKYDQIFQNIHTYIYGLSVYLSANIKVMLNSGIQSSFISSL